MENLPKHLSADAGLEGQDNGDVKKELGKRKGLINVCEGSAMSLLKNMIGRCWPGRLGPGDAKKKLGGRHGK